MELGRAEDEVLKKQAQILSIKTNKEYTAMEHEILALKVRISSHEDTILTLMEKVEEEAAHLKLREQEIQSELSSLDQQVQNQEQELVARKAELEQATQASETAREAVHKSLIGAFDKLYARHKGQAVVPMVDNTCSFCNVSLTPQTLNQLQDGWDIIRCESCSCILFAESETPPEVGGAT